MAIQRFHCPHCAGLFQVDDALAGQEVECPLCTGLIIVPAADVAPPEPGHETPPPPPDMLPMGTAVGYDAPPELLPGSLPMGSVPVGGLPTGTIPIGSVPMGSFPSGSMPVGSLPIGAMPMGMMPPGPPMSDLPPPPPPGFDVPPDLPPDDLPDPPAVSAADLLPPSAPLEPPADLQSPADLLPPTAPTTSKSKPVGAAPPSTSSPSVRKPRPVPQQPQRVNTPPPAPEFVATVPGPITPVSPLTTTSMPASMLPTTAPIPGVPGAAALDPMAPLGSITQPLGNPADEPQRDPDEIVDTRQKVKLVGTGLQQRELRKLSPEEKARRTKSRTIVTLIFCVAMLLLTMLLVMWREAIEKRDAEKSSEVLQRQTEAESCA